MNMITQDDKLLVDRLRARAKRHGYRVCKSRQGYHSNNLGGLRISDSRNTVVAGINFDLSADQAEYWLDRFLGV